MGGERKCVKCGAALKDGARFCSVCGTHVTASSPAVTGGGSSGEGRGGVPKKTMMAFGGEVPNAPSSPTPPAGRVTDPGVSQPPVGAAGNTVLGISNAPPPRRESDGAVKAPAPVAADPGAVASTSSQGPTSDKPTPGPDFGSAGRTMIGMPNADEILKAAAAAQAKAAGDGADARPAASASPVPKGTVMGIAPGALPVPGAPAASTIAKAEAPGGSAPAGGSAQPASAGGDRPSSKLANTVVGLSAADLSPVARAALEQGATMASVPPVPGEPQGQPEGAADSAGRTMLGVGLTGQRPAPDPDATEPKLRTTLHSEETLRPIKRGNPALLVGIVVLVVLGALAAYFATRGGSSSPRVHTDIVREGGLEYMQFTVAGAAEGSKLRFGGQEKPLQAGTTRFQLGVDSLTVGTNAVLVEVVDADGSVSSERIILELQHRVTLDTAPLRAGKSAVDVVVAAVPGSTVMLDGKPLALDAQGRGVRSDPLASDQAGADGSIEHVVAYRVQPPTGEAQVGELRTRIPLAALQIDRPGQNVVTDRDAIEIAGAVGATASVTVDGQAVAVSEGRFVHRLSLPQVGVVEPQVTATADGRAPHVVTLRIERVADLEQAAAGFQADSSLTYAKIAQNPAIYAGRKAAFEGRVYNVAVENGHSVLQVLARECPDGTRCPLWVTYPAATEHTVDSWVRALGVIAGEQKFRAENDEIRSVPKLEATFLLAAKP